MQFHSYRPLLHWKKCIPVIKIGNSLAWSCIYLGQSSRNILNRTCKTPYERLDMEGTSKIISTKKPCNVL